VGGGGGQADGISTRRQTWRGQRADGGIELAVRSALVWTTRNNGRQRQSTGNGGDSRALRARARRRVAVGISLGHPMASSPDPWVRTPHAPPDTDIYVHSMAQYFSSRHPNPFIWSAIPCVRYVCHTVAVLMAITGLPSSASSSAATLAQKRLVPAWIKLVPVSFLPPMLPWLHTNRHQDHPLCGTRP
jgi:hypothetical protein